MITPNYVRTVETLYQTGDHIELRGWTKKHDAYVGIYPFEDLPRAMQALDQIDGEDALDLYLCLNPTILDPRPFRAGAKGTWEHEVRCRRWFLLDGDTVTADKHIATDDEIATTIVTMGAAKGWLIEQGFEQVVLANSGNGVHLVVRCDLPNDKESKQLIRCVQNAVAKRFSDDHTKIECFPDANRIVRAYGTLNRKGTERPGLSWRRSGIVES